MRCHSLLGYEQMREMSRQPDSGTNSRYRRDVDLSGEVVRNIKRRFSLQRLFALLRSIENCGLKRLGLFQLKVDVSSSH